MTAYRSKSSKSSASSKQRSAEARGLKFCDRNLVPVNPLSEQFEPTDSQPISRRKRMAGTEL